MSKWSLYYCNYLARCKQIVYDMIVEGIVFQKSCSFSTFIDQSTAYWWNSLSRTWWDGSIAHTNSKKAMKMRNILFKRWVDVQKIPYRPGNIFYWLVTRAQDCISLVLADHEREEYLTFIHAFIEKIIWYMSQFSSIGLCQHENTPTILLLISLLNAFIQPLILR